MIFLKIVMFALVISAVMSAYVVMTGETKWDRLLGFGLVAAKINILIVIFAYWTGNSFYLDIALVYIILAYVGIVALADYLRAHGGSDRAR